MFHATMDVIITHMGVNIENEAAVTNRKLEDKWNIVVYNRIMQNSILISYMTEVKCYVRKSHI